MACIDGCRQWTELRIAGDDSTASHPHSPSFSLSFPSHPPSPLYPFLAMLCWFIICCAFFFLIAFGWWQRYALFNICFEWTGVSSYILMLSIDCQYLVPFVGSF